jgi:hypothetical protein
MEAFNFGRSSEAEKQSKGISRVQYSAFWITTRVLCVKSWTVRSGITTTRAR